MPPTTALFPESVHPSPPDVRPPTCLPGSITTADLPMRAAWTAAATPADVPPYTTTSAAATDGGAAPARRNGRQVRNGRARSCMTPSGVGGGTGGYCGQTRCGGQMVMVVSRRWIPVELPGGNPADSTDRLAGSWNPGQKSRWPAPFMHPLL